MLLIYTVVALVTALISWIILRLITKNRLLACSLSTVLTLLALAMTYLYIAPCYYTKNIGITMQEQNPFFAFIAKKSPNEYNAFVTKVQDDMRKNGKPINEIYFSNELTNNLLLKYGPNASDITLYDYLKENIALDKKLFAINPEYALHGEFLEKFKYTIPASERDIILKNVNESHIDYYAHEVIISGINNEHAAPTQNDIQQAKKQYSDIVLALMKKYGNDVVINTLKNPTNPALNQKNAAEIIITFSEAILATGQTMTGAMLRTSFMESRQLKPQ